MLDLEFKVAQGTNSGVFLRTSNPKDPVQTGIEIQVASSTPGRPLGKGSIGGIYDLVAPSANPLKPDDWNRYTITCQGPRISVVLNGQPVSEANLDQWTEPAKKPRTAAPTSSTGHSRNSPEPDTLACRITVRRSGTGTFASNRSTRAASAVGSGWEQSI